MIWEKELPTKPGWYWIKERDEIKIVQIGFRYGPELLFFDGRLPSRISGWQDYIMEWSGPISEPKKGC